MITAATFVVALFAPGMVVKTGTLILTYLESPHLIPMDQEHLIQIFWINGSRIITILGLPIALLSANLVQHKLIFSGQQMIPKISKLNPITGLKRMFSPRGLLEFTKSLFKIIIVAVVVLMLVLPERDKLTQLMAVDLQFILPFVRGLALRMLVAVAIIMMFISLIDFLYQKFDHRKNLRMSKQDIKDENKQADGDPAIKARIRSLRMERGRRRMMAAVPSADVIVTNPTHYAIALQYDAAIMDAPKLVAKGVDKLAARIRELAEEHGIPIVENPPLARAIYASVEIDREIPLEHYRAVADIIGYVMKIKGTKATRRFTAPRESRDRASPAGA